MAYQYDEMGNVIGEYESEEERRQREEAAKQLAHKVEVKTYGDGSQTQTTTREVPAPVAGPVPFNPADYNRSIAAQESGANPNIGYHNQQLSSAYGPYGMTAGAWQDARRANPSLPADITQATPEQMTAGQTAFTGQNAKYLQNYGVPVNDNTLSAAHFLGAKGLSDYLQTGYISPQAAAANGGEENVRRIVDQRLGGNFAPASGAVQPQAPQAAAPQTQEAAAPISPYSLATGQTGLGLQMPSGPAFNNPATTGVPMTTASAINTYQSAQDDPKQLMALRYDENVPEFIRERAGQRAYELMDQEIKQADAKQKATEMMTAAATGDRKAANDIAKTLTQSEGSWLKMLLLGFISPQLAGEEAIKLGFGNKWVQSADAEGNPALIEVNAKGMPLRGVKADNTPIAQDELISYAAGLGEQTKTLQTQAHHSAATAMDAMRKINLERADKKLPAQFTEQEIQQRGREVYNQTMRVTRGGSRVAGQTAMAQGGAAPATTGGLSKAEQAQQNLPTGMGVQSTAANAPPVAVSTFTTADGKPSTVFADWDKQRVGESTKDYGKRLEIRPEDVEQTAQALAKGQIKPTELTGRQNDFRRVAIQRALEINPNYTPMTYETTQKVINRYTSGKDHDTLVNTGTAVNHLMQYKDIAAQTPGNTDVSSWNTFYQNLMKYGNAPEIKSKEQMAGFVAGELVKAASGGQGSMTERIHQEKQLMAANTPAEVQMVIDNAIKLAHGRYSSMRSSFMGSTGRSAREFADITGLPDEAQRAFDKIDAQHAIKEQGSAAEKWARANPNDPRSKDILKRLGKE